MTLYEILAPKRLGQYRIRRSAIHADRRFRLNQSGRNENGHVQRAISQPSIECESDKCVSSLVGPIDSSNLLNKQVKNSSSLTPC
jgi:hypothetical protein